MDYLHNKNGDKPKKSTHCFISGLLSMNSTKSFQWSNFWNVSMIEEIDEMKHSNSPLMECGSSWCGKDSRIKLRFLQFLYAKEKNIYD